MSVEKLSTVFDTHSLIKDYEFLKNNNIIDEYNHQFCVTGIHPTANYLDGCGSLNYVWDKDKNNIPFIVQKKENILQEEDFQYYLEKYKSMYVREVYNELCKQYKIGRLRYLKLNAKTCYSWHRDKNKRIHIPVITHDDSCGIIIEDNIYRFKLPGETWLVDTTKYHTAFNAGSLERVHLVANIIE